MSGEKRFIGFDLGAESGRCVVAALVDGKIALDEVHRFTTHNLRNETGFHWDVQAIFDEIVEGLRKARNTFGPSFNAIGIDTWGVDYVLVDKDGHVLGTPYHYRDDRTDGMMERAFRIVAKEKMYGRSGTQFAQINTVFQLMAEMRNSPDFLNAADRMLLMPDFLNFMLTGQKKSEFTIASTTGLTDPKVRDWDWELIREFGFPEKLFAEIVEPGTRLGAILPSIVDRTGLDPDIPVVASAGHDTASAVASVPAEGINWAFLSSGTWSLMGIEVQVPIPSMEAMKFNFTNEGGVNRTTRFLKNIIGLWPVQECRREWASEGKDYSYRQLVDMASVDKSAGAWVDLSDVRFLKPGGMPGKIQASLGETCQVSNDDPGFIIRVIMESLAFSYRTTIEEIERVTGRRIEKLYAVGGGVQNELLMQSTADAIGKPVYAGPTEGAIVGNIGVLAVAAGAVPDTREWRRVVANSFEPKLYRPANAAYYAENEKRYRAILRER